MREMVLSLNVINDVKDFVRIINGFTGSYQFKSGRYVIDAKSILGIFSLDLSNPITLVMNDENEYDAVAEAISKYIVG